MDFQKLLNEWSMQTPQVVTLGTTSLYYLGLFAEFLAAQQSVRPTCFTCGHNLDSDGICTNLRRSGPFTAGG